MENSSEYYFEKLKDTPTPGNIIAAMYCTLYNIEVSKSEVIMMNKMVKIFGRFTVFFAVLDMAGSYPDDVVEKPYALLYTICKNKFESSHGTFMTQSHQSLDKFIESIEKEIESLGTKKVKAPSSEGLK